MISILAPVLALTLQATALSRPGDERQILWQRSLEDALAIQKDEHRPILVAVNMDGESASERIVRERYRDPQFVALTRRFVCLAASAFRHTPRDFDEEGRRIPCPRLGEVTCGEHMALEPILYDAYLGGERIAPRHALVLEDGRKIFDLYLLFDLRDLDRRLAEVEGLAPAPSPDLTLTVDGPALDDAAWSALAGRKENRARTRLEELLLAASPEACATALRVLASAAEAGSLHGLRILYARSAQLGPELAEGATEVALSRGLASPAAAMLRELITDAGPTPGTTGLGEHAHLLRALGALDRDGAANRSLILSYFALGEEQERWIAPGAHGTVSVTPEALEAALALAGGSLDTSRFHFVVRHLPARSGALSAEPELPAAADLERELADLERELSAASRDDRLQERWGRASLALARRRMETGEAGIEFLLGDAEQALAKASVARPKAADLLLQRARTAFYQSRFEEQERLALAAWNALPELPRGTLESLLDCDARGSAGFAAIPDAARALLSPPERIEALRWLGDACARLLGERSGGDPRQELTGIARGARALALAVCAPSAGDTDWVTLASFFAALGRRREELAFAQAGLERFPESGALRNLLNVALWSVGRPDLAVTKAEWLADRHPESGACAWYAGYALVQQGDWQRRAESPDQAIQTYLRAEEAFRKSLQLEPAFTESATYYLALCALGRGFAHLLAERRDEAASCLVEGIAALPGIAQVRDGLDREALDLLDGSLEWREAGESPVDSAQLLDRLLSADPGNSLWARSVADSELREALRADGRGEPENAEQHLGRSLAAARRAVAVSDEEANRLCLAQTATVLAERLLREGLLEQARLLLAEAGRQLQELADVEGLDVPQLRELADRLRERLGAARPLIRPGR